MKNELVKLMVDTYKGSLGEFSKEQANETLRKALIELNGGSEKIDPKAFRRNKIEIFEIIEVALDELINDIIDTQFNKFVEVRNLAWGDTNEFILPNNDGFKVAMVANGTANLLRQRLGDKGRLTVEVHPYAIKIYEELHRVLAGRVDWSALVNKVAVAFEKKLAEQIYSAFYGNYTSLGTEYKSSGAFNESAFMDIIEHVEADTQLSATIWGTRRSLAKITSAKESESMKDALNSVGYYGQFKGVPMYELKQFHKVGTSTFGVDDFLLVVPTGDLKIIKLVLEGDSIIDEFQNSQGDMSKEYMFIKNYGLAVAANMKYGMHKFV